MHTYFGGIACHDVSLRLNSKPGRSASCGMHVLTYVRTTYIPTVLDPKFKVFELINAEARESKDISEQSDIYGFGLLLIELLTGKSPADTEFGMQANIVEWARYCYSDCHLDVWIDRMIRGDAATLTDHYQNEIVQTMNLALHCTATDPTARPCASHVLKTLQSLLASTACVSALKFSSSTNY